MAGGTAVSLGAEVCAEGGIAEASEVVEVIGVMVEVVVLVAATEAVLCVVAGVVEAEPTVGFVKVVVVAVSVPESLSSLGAGSACTWTVCCPTW